ncbi:MAG: TRAP transporter substrate-binding protein [Firmicutes bacterium]|nr:TRAP transporter substrate-binding protein [Bacillota bacterium]
MTSRLAVAILIVLLALFAVGCGQRVVDKEQYSPEEKIVIRFSHVVPQNTPKGLAAKHFAQLVEQRTGGRVEVQVFPNSTLYKDGEELEALRSGAVQLIAPTTSKLGEMFPRWQLFDLPYAFRNRHQVHRAVEGEIWQELCQDLEVKNIKALSFWDNGFKQLTTSKRKIVSPADSAGLIFRVMINSQVLKAQFRAVEAVPLPLVFSELYRALQTHQVDGQENTISNIYAKKFYEVQPYLTVSNHGYLGYVVLANADFWASLPADIQQILEKTMAEVTLWERSKAQELNNKDFQRLVDSGHMKIYVQTAEEREVWVERFKPVYRRYASYVGKDLLKALKQLDHHDRRPVL